MTALLPCLACGGPTRPYYTARIGYTYSRCPACGSLRLAQEATSTHELYEDDNYGPELFDPAWTDLIDRRRTQPLAAVVRRHLPEGAAVLDVGAGGGHFVRQAARRGLDASGVEVSSRLAESARATYGVPVQAGRLEDVVRDDLDGITLWDVIEHVWEPHALLAEARARLRPGGLLFVSTPAVDSSVARAGKALFGWMGRWPHVLPPAHVAQFSRAGIRGLVTAAGFEVVELVNFETPLAAVGGVDAPTMRGRLGAARRDPRRALVTIALAVPFVYARLRQHGDAVIVVARRADAAA